MYSTKFYRSTPFQPRTASPFAFSPIQHHNHFNSSKSDDFLSKNKGNFEIILHDKMSSINEKERLIKAQQRVKIAPRDQQVFKLQLAILENARKLLAMLVDHLQKSLHAIAANFN